MTRSVRRFLLLALTVAALTAGIGVWLFWPRPSAITRESAAKIANGMTVEAAEAILGGPARDETTGPIELTLDPSDSLWLNELNHDANRPACSMPIALAASRRFVMNTIVSEAGQKPSSAPFSGQGCGKVCLLR